MLAVIGLILTLLAVPAYAITLEVPFLRSSGAVMFALAAIGLVLGCVALKKPGFWRRIALALNLAFAGLLVYGFFFMTALPKATHERLAAPVAFTLPDENGTMISSDALRKKGPIHLVLYRGHW